MLAENLLKDKRILITGGTTGIGRATALLLAQQGSRVMVIGRHKKELDDALDDIKTWTDDAVGMTADTSKKEDLERVFETLDKELGGLDIFVNNAALGGGNLFEEKYNEWKYMIDTNILGYISFAKHAADRIAKEESGHIINIGSMSADQREPESEVYVATKAAIQAFTESFRQSANKKGIKVSLIEPGAVGTDMQPQDPKEQRKMINENKMLKAEDIAQAVLFCLNQPERSDVVVLQIRPHQQII